MGRQHEIGAYEKPWKNRIKVALVYPNKYSVGMSSLGFQTMYRLLNEKPFITCDRVFLPEKAGEKPRSVENSRFLHEFDFILFSISYSTDYLKVFEILENSGIELSREERKSTRGPLIAAGGTAVYMNPEPLAPAFDFFFLGEGEIFADFFCGLVDSCPGLIGNRENFLESVKNSPGIYIPEYLGVEYGPDGTVKSFNPKYPEIKIKRAYVDDLKGFTTYSTLFSEKAEFGGLFMEEISRGCARGCRFCAIGFIGRPYRTRPYSSLEFLKENPPYKIGILGAAISDHPKIKEISRLALERGGKISFSSYRADKIDDETAEIISDAGIETFTIAPESSNRMRSIINKNLDDEELLLSAKKLGSAGVKNLKVYFMIGLPYEDQSVIADIVFLIKKIKGSFGGNITVSINPFIPKPFTPFQWFPMAKQEYLKRAFQKIGNEIRSKGVKIDRFNLKDATLDALFSKGSRTLGDKMLRLYKSKEEPARTLLGESKKEDHFIHTDLRTDSVLPWDFIDNHVEKSMLIKEFEKTKELASYNLSPNILK